MARNTSKKKRLHERAAQRRQSREKERDREARKQAAHRQQVSLKQRDRQRERAAAHPLKYMNKYENGATVLGEPMPAAFLVDRIKTFGWRESMLRLAHLASIVANDDLGPNSPRACAVTAAGIRSLTGSTPATHAMLARARAYVDNAKRPLVVAHEEALLFLQHVVLLHGSDSSTDGPTDAETAFWLLGASDHLGEWAKPDDSSMTDTERLAAELVKVHRFNRSEDSVRTALRTDGIFGAAPWQGKLSGTAWQPLQQLAFDEDFRGYFDSFVLPLFVLSHAWGSGLKVSDELPIIRAERFSAFGGEGPRFLSRLRSITASREELRSEIAKRMKPDGLLPHAPTALLHRPLIDLGEHGVLAATPWYVRNFVRTGIWNRYREATKQTVGERKGGDEWNRAFQSEARTRWLSHAEFPKLLAALDTTEWMTKRVSDLEPDEAERKLREHGEHIADRQLFVTVACFTGAELSALSRLDWTDVDFVAGRIRIPGTKNATRDRTIDLDPQLAAALRRVPPERQIGPVLRPWANACTDLRAACKRADIERVTPHTFRHTFGSWLVQAGVDSFVVGKLAS